MPYRLENAKAVGATDKGIWVQADDLDDEVFVPDSQIDEDSEVYKKGTEGTLIVTDWFARKKDWSD